MDTDRPRLWNCKRKKHSLARELLEKKLKNYLHWPSDGVCSHHAHEGPGWYTGHHAEGGQLLRKGFARLGQGVGHEGVGEEAGLARDRETGRL